MRATLIDAVSRRGGIISRDEALSIVPVHILDKAVKAGSFTRLYNGVYALADIADLRTTRLAAAAKYTGAAVSCVDASNLWNVLPPPRYFAQPESEAVHLLAPGNRGPCRSKGIRLHRQIGFEMSHPHVTSRHGFPVVSMELALVTAWSDLPGSERRTPIIDALRERRTTAARLREALSHHPFVAGAAEMTSLIDLVEGGCHSEMELRGHAAFLAHAFLRCARSQVPVPMNGGTIFIDRYLEDILLAVEWDGAEYHGSQIQRERDIHRDVHVASYGVQTVRFSHRRLWYRPGDVIAELAAIAAARRAQLGPNPRSPF